MINHFANNLKTLRKMNGLKQHELAELCRIKKHCIGAYEEGRSEPNIDNLIVLSIVLKVSLNQLVINEIK